VDWECGGRDKATCGRLLERLKRWRTRLYCADEYAVYDVLLPVGQLHTGKNETHGIERDNARQRHWLARFRRRSIVVSKAKRMVDVSIALFARFAVIIRSGPRLCWTGCGSLQGWRSTPTRSTTPFSGCCG
jgi:insertion element IS1 protein InsB